MTSPPRPIVDEAIANSKPSATLDLAQLPTLLPHAPPFRLIDRVVAADRAAGTLVAERRMTASCALWPAESTLLAADRAADLRFPDVLVIEALCQAAACLNILDAAPDAARHHHGYLVAISNFRFRQVFDSAHAESPNVRPTVGDTLILQVKRDRQLGAMVAFSVVAHVKTDAITHELASGQLLFAIA